MSRSPSSPSHLLGSACMPAAFCQPLLPSSPPSFTLCSLFSQDCNSPSIWLFSPFPPSSSFHIDIQSPLAPLAFCLFLLLIQRTFSLSLSHISRGLSLSLSLSLSLFLSLSLPSSSLPFPSLPILLSVGVARPPCENTLCCSA
jgi:hypothetical protein